MIMQAQCWQMAGEVSPNFRCPVCLHSSFTTITALWQGLMSGASRRLACPVCHEVLLGLDKLTLHLYSHLPAVATVDSADPASKDPSSTTGPSSIETKTANNFSISTSDIAVSHSAHGLSSKDVTRFAPRQYICSESQQQQQHQPKGQQTIIEVSEKEIPNSSFTQLQFQPMRNDASFLGTAEKQVFSNSPGERVFPSEERMGEPIMSVESTLRQKSPLTSSKFDADQQCPECGALFPSHRMLTTHVQLVHPESVGDRPTECPFACHLCSKRFKMKGSLMVHVRFVHGGARLARGIKARAAPVAASVSTAQESNQQQAQDSPEPFFPSLSELSEQLNSSPPQAYNVLQCNSPSTLHVQDVMDADHEAPTARQDNVATTRFKLSGDDISADKNLGSFLGTSGSAGMLRLNDNVTPGNNTDATRWVTAVSCIRPPRLPKPSSFANSGEQLKDEWTRQRVENNKSDLDSDMNVIISYPSIIETTTSCVDEGKASTNGELGSGNGGAPELCCANKISSGGVGINKSSNGNDSNKMYECEVCSKRFTTKYFHKKHQRLHTGERPYKCTTCNKTFAFQQSFHKHLLYHTSAKPHVCAECGQAFKELSTLHNHQRIHTGERPFVCETCGKAFRQRVSYLVHRRIHTGVLPYKCSACNKSFRYKVSQRTHKCPMQPPGNVFRQSELVQRLLMRAPLAADFSTSTSPSAQHVTLLRTPPPPPPTTTLGQQEALLMTPAMLVQEETLDVSQTDPQRFPPLLTINEESLHQLLSIFPN